MKTIRVVAAVICNKNSVFATARGYGEYKGWWEFPGGKVEIGETPEDALVREIKEELASDILVEQYIDTVEYDYPSFHLSMSCYYCKLLSGELTLKEAEDARWLTKDTLEDVMWLPADIMILEKVKERLQCETNMVDTLDYYNKNAFQFVQGTMSVDFKQTQDIFLNKLFPNSYILDFGCGSGRDSKYFIESGYKVDATDGSEELCKMATEYTGIAVRQMLFEELNEIEKYDGIWACSSILHLSKPALFDVLKKMVVALKNGGVVYTSFKYGDYEGLRNDRYFTDFTLASFKEYIRKVPELKIEDHWITGDVRPGRGEEKWLNLILRKSITR